jgi:hypothetical protein
VRDELEDVEARDALGVEELGGLRFRLLQDRGEDIARVNFRPLRALHVQHRRLQHAPEGRRLLGLALLAAPDGFDDLVEVVAQVAPQADQVGAAAFQNPLALGIVRQGVQQVLERQVGVPARHGLAIRDGEHDFERGGEHVTFLLPLGGSPRPADLIIGQRIAA